MHDVADKVGDLGTIGAIAAAIAAFALACRMRGPKLDERPVGFPNDANATLKKYENAYLQLVTKSADRKGMDGITPETAIEYAVTAFEDAKGSGLSTRKTADIKKPKISAKPAAFFTKPDISKPANPKKREGK